MKSTIAMVIAPIFAFTIVIPATVSAAPLGKKRPVLVVSDTPSSTNLPAPTDMPQTAYGTPSNMDTSDSEMTAIYVPPSAPPIQSSMTPEPDVSYAAPVMDTAPNPTSARTMAKTTEDAPRPIVKIKFDQPDVAYEQPVYMAMSEAMKRYPSAKFEMVAVSPLSGNAAQMAIESAHARRNAEAVLRSLNTMGLDVKGIELRAEQSAQAQTNEVVIMMR